MPALLNVALYAVLLVGAGCGAPGPQGELPPVEDLARVQQAAVDCTEWTDTGYVSGTPFEITLVTVDGKPVEVNTANAYSVMQDAAAAAGVNIAIVSGFRTNAEQEYLYNCYVNCNCNNCNLAAKPGYSNHQSGHALDLNTSTGSVLSWLNAHGAEYGFEATVASEDWHWEWWGGGPGGGPCNGTPTPCTVTTTGKSGECMATAKCAALGNHESTPGYCPGPADIQCCTAIDAPPPDAAVEDTAAPPDTGPPEDAGTVKDAGSPKDAGTVKDAAADADAGSKGSAGFYNKSSDSSGGCRLAGGAGPSPASHGAFPALFAALAAALATRRLRATLRRG